MTLLPQRSAHLNRTPARVRRTAGPRRHCHPRLEVLEDRLVPHFGLTGEFPIGHMMMQVNYASNAWTSSILDEVGFYGSPGALYSPSQYLFPVRPEDMTTRGASGLTGTTYNFLGVPDDSTTPIWVLSPGGDDTSLGVGVYLGDINPSTFKSYVDSDPRLDPAAGANPWVHFTLTSVTGPAGGNVSAWEHHGDGTITQWISSADGINANDTIIYPAGSHNHFFWAFTQPGGYQLSFQASAYLPDGTLTSSQTFTYKFFWGGDDHGNPYLLPVYQVIPGEGANPVLALQASDGTANLAGEDALLGARSHSEIFRPSGSQWNFLGVAAGAPVWVLTDYTTSGQQTLGVYPQNFPTSSFQSGSNLVLKLKGVSGPGAFSVFTTDGASGAALASTNVTGVFMTSADGVDPAVDQLTIPLSTLSQKNYALGFTAAGVYDITFELTGTLSDGTAISSGNQVLHYEVRNNAAPVINAQTFNVNEEAAAGTVVSPSPGKVVATDASSGDTLTYSITGGNTNNAFKIDSATGAISVNNPAAIDYDTVPGHQFLLTVKAADNNAVNPLSSSTTITINLNNVTEVPTTISVTGGSSQSATVGAAYATPFQVLVKDQFGLPLSGVTVTFTAPGSGAGGTFAGAVTSVNATTDGSGIATAGTFTANTHAGDFSLQASVSGIGSPASFSLTNNPGAPATVTTYAGTPQSTSVGSAYSTGLKALVEDGYGNPVSGVTVTFSAPGSGASGTFPGSVTTTTATTNASGIAAAPTFTANTHSGSFVLSATVAGLGTPANYSLSNTASAPASITATAGTPQQAIVGTSYVTLFQALVLDSFGNPVSGASVTFTAPANGPRGTFTGGLNSVIESTNAAGVATATTFTAGGQAGPFNVQATVSGLGLAAVYAATNAPGSPAAVSAVGGTPQSTAVGNSFIAPLQVLVQDAFGNPLSGVSVTFSAQSPGAGGTFSGGLSTVTVVTDLSGFATAPTFSANGSSGTYTVQARVNGIGGVASFALTNEAVNSGGGSGSTGGSTSGSGGSKIYAVGADAGAGPQVTVYDAISGALKTSFYAFDPSFRGGVRVAVGDVNGDGTDDVITAAGAGAGPQVTVYDGKTFQPILSFYGVVSTFRGGLYVAAGDVNGDGYADVIVSADKGGGPQVTVTSGKDGRLLTSFYATVPTFSGGIRVAGGDVNGDGFADVVAVAGPGGGPQVTIFDGKTLGVSTAFYAMVPSFTGGLFVAAGDLNGDGKADIVAGAGPGGGPQVSLFNGPDQSLLGSFFAMAPNFTGGVRVGTVDTTGNGRASILTAAGPGGRPQVTVFDGLTLEILGSFFAFAPGFGGGTFIS